MGRKVGNRILLDSNVWRYIVDADALADVHRAARASRHVIVVSPAVLFEAAHSDDRNLRERLLSAMTRPGWKRLMPEAYWQSEELKGEVRRLRPEWLRPTPDLTLFRRVRHDWLRSRGGVWDHIADQAELLQRHDAASLARSREQSRRLRSDAQNWPVAWETAPLTKTFGSLPEPTPGWNGLPFEPWRFDALNVFEVSIRTDGHPLRDWLDGELNLPMMLLQSESLTKFWLHDVDLLRMPRHWLRWAFEFLQRLRKVTDGTPVDAQLGTYLLDADLLASADKTFIWIATRCQRDAPFNVAQPLLVPAGERAPDEVLRLLRSS